MNFKWNTAHSVAGMFVTKLRPHKTRRMNLDSFDQNVPKMENVAFFAKSYEMYEPSTNKKKCSRIVKRRGKTEIQTIPGIFFNVSSLLKNTREISSECAYNSFVQLLLYDRCETEGLKNATGERDEKRSD